jgi:dienelactone hydrolase
VKTLAVGVLALGLGLVALLWPASLPVAAISLAYDPQPQRAPVVLLLGGSEGGRFSASHPMVQGLHQRGFHVARVAYFGTPDTPPHLDRIALDPFDDLIATLSADPAVDARCIFVLGASKGGELALLLAADNPRLTAVAALVPAHVVFQSSRITLQRHSSWRRGEVPLAFVPYPRLSMATLRGVLGLSGCRDMHEAALAHDSAVTQAAIQVERITAPLFLAGSPDDTIWPSDRMVQAIATRLTAAGQTAPTLHTAPDHFVLNHGQSRAAVLDFLTAQGRDLGCLS